jgi:peroxiredoxin Q/BCP
MILSALLILGGSCFGCGGSGGGATGAGEATATGDEAPSNASSEARGGDAAAGLLAEGTAAPDFSVPDQTGAVRTLTAERGHPVVLYFYPRDATPGCTREACGFRDAWARYEAVGARVFGVSVDDVASHRAFAEEHELPFPLLADTEAQIADAYGVSHDAGTMARVTFLIGPDGTIARVYPSVDPGVHADELLGAIASLGE